MSIGNRIKQRRIELGLSADDLANRINKSRATVYRYENGDIENMPTTVLEPLAKALDTTPADLMGWKIVSDEDIGNIFYENMQIDAINKLRPVFTKQEVSHFENYIQLTEKNMKMVDNYTQKLLSLQEMENEVFLNAAQARTDIKVPKGTDTSDDDIMDDENF